MVTSSCTQGSLRLYKLLSCHPSCHRIICWIVIVAVVGAIVGSARLKATTRLPLIITVVLFQHINFHVGRALSFVSFVQGRLHRLCHLEMSLVSGSISPGLPHVRPQAQLLALREDVALEQQS